MARSPKITISDDDGELAVFAGNAGSASFVYGHASFVGDILAEAGRTETAEWIGEEAVGDIAWLTGIEVAEGRRGDGVGSALLRRGLAELEDRGVDLVVLHALADYGYSEKLDAWYRRHGFSPAGELDGLPFYYMHLGGDD